MQMCREEVFPALRRQGGPHRSIGLETGRLRCPQAEVENGEELFQSEAPRTAVAVRGAMLRGITFCRTGP